jgi:hypothetical protein
MRAGLSEVSVSSHSAISVRLTAVKVDAAEAARHAVPPSRDIVRPAQLRALITREE